jgi:hypothetical protein
MVYRTAYSVPRKSEDDEEVKFGDRHQIRARLATILKESNSRRQIPFPNDTRDWLTQSFDIYS